MAFKIFTVTLLLFSLQPSRGQDFSELVRGLSWRASSLENSDGSGLIPYSGTWNIKEGSIEWVQPKEKYNYSFSVDQINGEWNPATKTGRFSAQVSFRNKRGRADFIREKELSQIQFFIESGGRQLFPYRFNISAIE